jgi:transcriptional regulator with XRE-family HTH domain
MAIGPILQEARLKKQLTTSQVAERTRMKVQLVEDLESDDFHRMAAVIYGKGFIKLFAECVGLDPAPLIADYVLSVQGNQPSLIPDGKAQPLIQKVRAEPTSEPAPEPEIKPEIEPEIDTEVQDPSAPAGEPADLFAYASKGKRVVTERHESQASSIKQAIGRKVSRTTKALKAGSGNLTTSCRGGIERAGNRLADIPWGDAPLKVIGVIIGILVVLLFIVSGISRYVDPQEKGPQTDDELHIAVDPPEPYFD